MTSGASLSSGGSYTAGADRTLFHPMQRRPLSRAVSVSILLALGARVPAAPADVGPEALPGQTADVAPSAYAYASGRPADQNPPESWIGLLQYAGLPFDERVDPSAPAFRKVLCSLLWEEVRPIRRVELTFGEGDRARPS